MVYTGQYLGLFPTKACAINHTQPFKFGTLVTNRWLDDGGPKYSTSEQCFLFSFPFWVLKDMGRAQHI